MKVPEDRRYTDDDFWAKPEGEVVRIGITDFAQDQLGEIVYVDLPAVGATITAGESMGIVESTKTASDLIAPITGFLTARNDALDDDPDLVNRSPYGDGWMAIVGPENPAKLESLTMSAQDYRSARS